MIERIQLAGFKAFDTLDLLLGRLTLLSGLNSAGKSSILQAFALVRQSLDAGMLGPRKQTDLLLNGTLVELGTASDIYCEYSRRVPPEMTLSFYSAANDNIGWRARVENPAADVLPVEKFSGKYGTAFARLARRRFQYLRADRLSPGPVYPRSHREVVRKRSLGAQGQYTVHYLTQFRDDVVANRRVRVDNVGRSLLSQVTHWMGKISPDVRIEPEAMAGTDFVRVRFGFGSSGGLTGSSLYRPTHVGFGLTYTLPVVVALLATPPRGLLLLENPEAHIHPRGQAALGTLISLAASGGTQVLLETHSDHVLNGIRLALPCTHIIRSGQLQHAPAVQCGSRWLRWTFVRNRAT